MRSISWTLIIVACLVSLALGFLCGGCSRAEPAPKQPRPSRVIAKYSVLGNQAVEFRASNGNICVFVASGYSGVLDCSPPLPPLNYEDLPSVEGEHP